MNRELIEQSVEMIGDSYIEEAASFKGERKGRFKVLKWGAVAACAAVAAVAAAAIMRSSAGKVNVDNDDRILPRPYGQEIQSEASALIFPWEYLTETERYGYVDLKGEKYRAASAAALTDETVIGEKIGVCEGSGYDTYTDRTYTESFEAYAVRGADTGRIIAVKYTDGYHIMQSDKYDPPKTLGELFAQYGLADRLKLGFFTEDEEYREQGAFMLEDSAGFVGMLSGCTDAPFIENDNISLEGKRSIAFTVNCPELGISNRVLHITDDGLLITNSFDWGYVYEIGKENAQRLISFAKEHSSSAVYESTRGMIGGEIVEIGEGYIKIDDSVLCKDKSRGMVFTVPTDDLRIGRCLEFPRKAEAGDIIAVYFDGGIDTDNGNTVIGVYDLTKARLWEGDIIINE